MKASYSTMCLILAVTLAGCYIQLLIDEEDTAAATEVYVPIYIPVPVPIPPPPTSSHWPRPIHPIVSPISTAPVNPHRESGYQRTGNENSQPSQDGRKTEGSRRSG